MTTLSGTTTHATATSGRGDEWDAHNKRTDAFAENLRQQTWERGQTVVDYERDQVRIRQDEMVPGVAYSFKLFGVPVLALKRASGEVDFYYPEEE